MKKISLAFALIIFNSCYLFSQIPSLSTTYPTSITEISAIGGGNITNGGGSSVTGRGVCWDTIANPTIAQNHTFDGSGTGVFSSSFSGLITGKTYFVRAYAENDSGTAYGNQVSFVSVIIGSRYQGGKVYYFFKPGDKGYISNTMHGLIVSPSYIGNAQWGSTKTVYGIRDEIGDGISNTVRIVQTISGNNYAAKICFNYSVLEKGVTYNGWFLPSKKEALALCLVKNIIFPGEYVFMWTSSSDDGMNAFSAAFQYCAIEKGARSFNRKVYAVRAF